jgi:FkbM family methyltransferase
MFYGQYKQDKYLYDTFFKDKKDGVFLDIGASDGIRYSNSLFFEKLGWTGLCVEPREEAFKKLSEIRNCYKENIAISDKAGDYQFQQLDGWGSGLSGIVSNYNPQHVQRIAREKKHPKHVESSLITVHAVPLQLLLDKYELTNIDFMSLDVEGGELPVLNSIDWNKTRISVICVENNYNTKDIPRFLKSKGYKYVTRISCDEIYKLE